MCVSFWTHYKHTSSHTQRARKWASRSRHKFRLHSLKLYNCCSHISLVTHLVFVRRPQTQPLSNKQTTNVGFNSLELHNCSHSSLVTLSYLSVGHKHNRFQTNKLTNTRLNSLKLHNSSNPSLVTLSCLSGGNKHNRVQANKITNTGFNSLKLHNCSYQT